MARGMDDPARASGAFSHFLLSTDGEALYRPDDVLLRSVITSDDADRLTRTTRIEAERWASRLRDVGELDVVSTLARMVPLRIVGDYLGVPWSDQDTPAPLPGLRGGDRFPLDDDLVRRFSFNQITAGACRPRRSSSAGSRTSSATSSTVRPAGPLQSIASTSGGSSRTSTYRLRARTVTVPVPAARPRGGRAGHDADPPATPPGRPVGPWSATGGFAPDQTLCYRGGGRGAPLRLDDPLERGRRRGRRGGQPAGGDRPDRRRDAAAPGRRVRRTAGGARVRRRAGLARIDDGSARLRRGTGETAPVPRSRRCA